MEEAAGFERAIAQATSAIAALNAEQHREDKAIVAHDAQLQHAAEELGRLQQKAEQLVRERRQAEEERETLDGRQAEARRSIERLDGDQRAADERLTLAQRRLFEARETAQDINRQAADAGAAHAALVERAAALAVEVQRLEEASAELDARTSIMAGELSSTAQRASELRTAIADGKSALDDEIRALETLRGDLRVLDDAVAALKDAADSQETVIRRPARISKACAPGSPSSISRARRRSDLTHLAQSCLEAVQATLDEVLEEVTAQEAAGTVAPDTSVLGADDARSRQSTVNSRRSMIRR